MNSEGSCAQFSRSPVCSIKKTPLSPKNSEVFEGLFGFFFLFGCAVIAIAISTDQTVVNAVVQTLVAVENLTAF